MDTGLRTDMSDDGGGGLDQPITRWHELRKTLDHATMTIAVMNERQKTAAEQGTRIEASIAAVHARLDSLNSRTSDLEKKFMAWEEKYHPVRTVVYGLVGLILVGVVGALITLVLIK